MKKWIKVRKDLKIHYWREGKGQPLLFIHGLGGSLNNWKDNYPYFKEKGFEVIGLDLPGYGKSSKPRLDYTISYYAEVVKDFVQALRLSEPPVIIGNSMGGHIGVYYAAKYKSRLKGLVIVDGSGLNEMSFIEEYFIHMTFDQNHIGTILKYMMDIFTIHIFHNPSGQFARDFAEEQREMSQRSDYGDYCHALEMSTKAMVNQPVKDILTEIQVPVMIIWGSNDRLVPSFYGRRYHEMIEGSQMVTLSRCGHVPQMEKADEFNRALYEFLTEKELILEKPVSIRDKILNIFSKD